MLGNGATVKNVMFNIVYILSCGQRAILCIITHSVLLSFLCVYPNFYIQSLTGHSYDQAYSVREIICPLAISTVNSFKL